MKELPIIIKGNSHKDERGTITFNNNFDASLIKRMYYIENNSLSFMRAWQGHKIESRWFTAVSGSFKIIIISMEDLEKNDKKPLQQKFTVQSQVFDILHVPNGYYTSIQALVTNSKLLAMSDYVLGEVQDEHRLESNYFTN